MWTNDDRGPLRSPNVFVNERQSEPPAMIMAIVSMLIKHILYTTTKCDRGDWCVISFYCCSFHLVSIDGFIMHRGAQSMMSVNS